MCSHFDNVDLPVGEHGISFASVCVVFSLVVASAALFPCSAVTPEGGFCGKRLR